MYERYFSEEQLPQVVSELQQWAPNISRWLLYGPMGVGKTALVRAWIGEQVASPTFTYINHYSHAVHVDLYRFPAGSPSRWADVYTLLEEAPLIFVEWAEKLPEPPPLPWAEVHLSFTPTGHRYLRALIRDN
ncbi:MAG: tRNA (adenosine(37)-N6)-threonylcarbamoyltransferase complex ATPase subunit type 1 TsaE [Bacteroidia bacterium]|nr:tRNA (adenosine(37)-N6)-threonylcarbamoyltransferase complex ATPase subunit type 1 TsaE [Bacteroidia bacterium]MDW8014670.1 tRNA (adenosine(37)-N6)-threonylcarbamoyltransferase complex ATPase subunit type 1 TsaE [Bacteroidia bacterium]